MEQKKKNIGNSEHLIQYRNIWWKQWTLRRPLTRKSVLFFCRSKCYRFLLLMLNHLWIFYVLHLPNIHLVLRNCRWVFVFNFTRTKFEVRFFLNQSRKDWIFTKGSSLTFIIDWKFKSISIMKRRKLVIQLMTLLVFLLFH